MNIEKSLKNLRKTQGKIDALKNRINFWQECLDTMTDEEIAEYFVNESSDTYRNAKSKK